MARQARLDRPPHAGDAGVAAEGRRVSSPIRRQQAEQPAYAKNESRSIKPPSSWWSASARTSAARRRSPRRGARGPSGGLARRLLLPVPRLALRLAGRVYKNKPAPDNLPVPPYKFLSATRRSSSAKTRREPEAHGRSETTVTGTAFNGLLTWVDAALPADHDVERARGAGTYAPKNFNFWYYFGSLALFVLVLQIVTGIFLTMHYKPDAAQAFASVEYIMRDVPWGWLIRYMHSTGASAFFIVVYLHMFRGLLYGSLPQAARARVDLRHADLPHADGRSVLRLPAAVGADVVLGRAGDREPVRRAAADRRRTSRCGYAAITRCRTRR